jgi:predicted AlkP superfamily phosphohydrolase/phosphomutase/Flp pilus assembly protein TadD
MSFSSSKTLLVGWDAAEWKIIRPLIEQGLMPNFRRLMEEGIAGSIHSGHPLLSPTLWTSLVTGRHPVRHGILGAVELGIGGAKFRPIGRGACKSPPIWSVLDRAGVACHSINFPATHPAEHLHGVSVSNLFAIDAKAKDSVWPVGFRKELDALRVRPEEIDAASISTFLPKAGEVDRTQDPRLKQIAAILAHTATVHAAATWALENVAWQFAAVCYTGLHQFSHGFMRYHPPRMEGVSERDFEIYGGVVIAAYRFHDMTLGRLIELAGPGSNILLASDHGFRTGALRPVTKAAGESAMLAWHRPVGICVMSGPVVKRDSDFRHLKITEIAPMVLSQFGISPEEDSAVVEVETSEEAQQSIEYLRDLGYAEVPDIHAEFDARQLERRRQYYLAVAMLDSQRTRQAISILIQLLREDERNLEYRIALAHAYALSRQTTECRKLVDQFLRENPNSAAALAGLGMLELAARRAGAAVAHFQKARELGHASPSLLADIGRGFLRLRMFTEAKKAFEDSLGLDDELAGAEGGLATALLGEGDATAAVSAARRAISLSRLEPAFHYALGLGLLQLNQLPEARTALEECVHLDPEFVVALHKLTDICERLGQVTQARDYDRRAHLSAARRRIAMFQEERTAQSFRD